MQPTQLLCLVRVNKEMIHDSLYVTFKVNVASMVIWILIALIDVIREISALGVVFQEAFPPFSLPSVLWGSSRLLLPLPKVKNPLENRKLGKLLEGKN